MTQVEESKHFNQKSQIKTEWVVTQKLSIAISKNLGGCENLYSRTEPENNTKESCMYKIMLYRTLTAEAATTMYQKRAFYAHRKALHSRRRYK